MTTGTRDLLLYSHGPARWQTLTFNIFDWGETKSLFVSTLTSCSKVKCPSITVSLKGIEYFVANFF